MMANIRFNMKSINILTVAASVVVLAGVIMLSVSIGTASIPADVVGKIIASKLLPWSFDATWNAGRENIVWELRMPRALLGVLVGAGLGMAGAVMQSVTRNPLADPHLLGVSAGAALGANIAIIVTGDVVGALTVPLFAFAGALVSTMMVIGAARFSRATSPTKLVLAGVAISFILTACTSFLTVKADPRTMSSVVFWMLGGLGLGQWDNLIYPVIAVVIAACIFMSRANALNALAMGDETAVTLGVDVTYQRFVLLITNAFLTGVLVAYSGLIGFVGLMMPHIARLLGITDNRLVLPASAALGAVFLVMSDIAARVLAAPNDLPLGIVTGSIGGLFFVLLLRR
jgi:iron complex transport system permease protein